MNKLSSRIIMILIFVVILLCSTNNFVYADVNSETNIYYRTFLNDGESCFMTSTEYVTMTSTGEVSIHSIEELLDKIRNTKYNDFINSYGSDDNAFPSTDLAMDKFETGKLLEYRIIYEGYNDLNSEDREEDISKFKIKAGSITYTFVVPSSHYWESELDTVIENGVEMLVGGWVEKSQDDAEKYYRWDSAIVTNTIDAIKRIEKAVKDGFIAGSVGTGINVGTVYSTDQKPLTDLMIERGYNDNSNSDNKQDTDNSSNTNKSGLFKFKSNLSLKASLDYFYSPLFGKMELSENFPRTAEDWSKNKYYNQIDIKDGTVEIDDGYKNFVIPNSTARVGLYDVDASLDFTNGVKPYVKGAKVLTQSKEPKKFLDYTMRVAVPKTFTPKGVNNVYSLASGGLQIIEGIRMSVYNDTIYKEETADTLEREVICTNNDLDLSRNYLALFNQEIDGEPVGVVIVLKYSEAVVDTTGDNSSSEEGQTTSLNDKVYLTGRNIILNNNYSSSLGIDTENKDVMSYSTKFINSQGIRPRNFAFPSEGNATEEFLTNTKNHDVIGSNEDFSFLITFVGNTKITEVEGTEGGVPYGFVIFRNNIYVKDNKLLNWLSTEEVKSMGFIKSNELRALINGEFGKADLSFTDWLEMERIKKELNYKNDTILYRVINVIIIFIGALFIIFGMLFILAYWFDIFNTFSDISILYIISGRNMYPVDNSDIIDYVSREKSATKYVTFKHVLIVSVICWIIGFLFLKGGVVLEFILSVYRYLSQIIW